MPEVEDVTESEPESTTEEGDLFPELRIARRLGNLMEKADPVMRVFLLSWLNSRYGER